MQYNWCNAKHSLSLAITLGLGHMLLLPFKASFEKALNALKLCSLYIICHVRIYCPDNVKRTGQSMKQTSESLVQVGGSQDHQCHCTLG